jgi:putative hydrolase of the HAD superfamily
MIKAVTIDFWGTLLFDGPGADEDYRRPRLSGLQRVLRDARIPMSLHDLESAYDASAGRLRDVWRGCRDVPVQEHVSGLLEALHPSLPQRLAPEILAALVEAYTSPALRVPPAFDPGAKSALGELASRGLALCVVSNIMRTPGTVLRQLLAGQGLLELFRVLTFSDECGVRKPDPLIFWLTLDELGVAPEHAVHVGDDPVLDVQGAKDAGMRAIHVASSRSARPRVKPDAVIPDLGQLVLALQALKP